MDIKRVSTRSNRGIFAVTKSGYSSNKVFFGIGRHIKEESKSVAREAQHACLQALRAYTADVDYSNAVTTTRSI
jgi:hypothetical protein